jgi:hypothetical protein
MFEAHLLTTAILPLCSFALRFAGSRPLLSTIDYRTINYSGQFNSYVGARMLLLAAVAACCAIPLAALCVVVWVGIGSKQFAITSDNRRKELV